ncbi:uncharacterized protein LOC105698899 [Orussus abietinus]|uniref:uncharacterized protein LOC105698899 n=1 Tax=Orussus abietinus TaxID=222816 RepID=UPI000626350F|nr:uncharacterized protein LOC105698899 [Orussus abietinus]XP_012278956.1 uncharacterized protein LOC105698899 [Orussus abietinus]
MSEYCEYMWNPTRGHADLALARSIYEDGARLDVRDKKLAIKTVRAILRDMPGVNLKDCTDEYITRFLLARKYRTEQAAVLIAAYQAQVAHRQDIFGNLTARDPAIQRALRAGIPGVLPARDRKGRCVLVVLASQWDPIAVPALSVQRAIFLVLEILIQDPRNQQSGFVAVVDWGGFSLRQGGALGAAALRNLIAALRGRFPARFKAIHFLSAPLYVQATLALVKPFLDEKTRNKIYLHGNNLSTLHQHLPTDILPAELGGTGPAFNPGLWAEPVIHSAMKEAELAAIKREQERVNVSLKECNALNNFNSTDKNGSRVSCENLANGKDLKRTTNRTSFCNELYGNDRVQPSTCDLSSDLKNAMKIDEGFEWKMFDQGRLVELKDMSSRKTTEGTIKKPNSHESEESSSKDQTANSVDNKDDYNMQFREYKDAEESGEILNNMNSFTRNMDLEDTGSQSETNSNEFEMISSHPDSEDTKDNSLEMKAEKAVVRSGRAGGILPEEASLIIKGPGGIQCINVPD